MGNIKKSCPGMAMINEREIERERVDSNKNLT